MIFLLLLSLSQPPIINDAAPLTIAASIDYFSTQYALDSPNTREANPLGVSKPAHVALKSVFVVGETILIRKIRARNPKHAKIVKYALVISQVTIGAWNVQLAIKQRRKFDATAR